MKRLAILALGVAFGLAAAGHALAQGTGQKPAPQAPAPAKPATAKPSDRPGLTVHGVVSFGLTSLASSRSFDAVAGTHSATTFGIGAEVQNIWKNVFAGVSFAPMSLAGERVFLDSGTIYPLGIPVDISVNALDVVGGWRFVMKPKGAKPAPPKPGQKPASKDVAGQAKPGSAAAKPAQPPSKAPRLVPFVAGGLSMVSYKESSQNSAGEDVSQSASGFVFLGGVDYRVTKWIHVGGEIRYRAVTGVLGTGGVSKEYGEKSLGGWVVAARVSVGK